MNKKETIFMKKYIRDDKFVYNSKRVKNNIREQFHFFSLHFMGVLFLSSDFKKKHENNFKDP
jgi:hypothetical protein